MGVRGREGWREGGEVFKAFRHQMLSAFFFKHNKFAHVAATLLKMIAVYQSTTVTGDCYQSNLEMFWRRINYSDFFFVHYFSV